MSLNKVPSGKDLPNDFNVIIEIPMHGEPVNTKWTRNPARSSWIAS